MGNEGIATTAIKMGERIPEYQNKHFSVYSQEVDFGSFTKKYYVSQYFNKAGLLIVDDNSVLLARQYRLLINRSVWEVPGGKIEDGESASESAVRECEEETGFRGLNVRPLIQYPQGLDSISAGAELFYTTEFERVKEFTANPAEVDKIQWFEISDCMDMIKKGEILDHFTIIALLYYQYIKKRFS